MVWGGREVLDEHEVQGAPVLNWDVRRSEPTRNGGPDWEGVPFNLPTFTDGGATRRCHKGKPVYLDVGETRV